MRDRHTDGLTDGRTDVQTVNSSYCWKWIIWCVSSVVVSLEVKIPTILLSFKPREHSYRYAIIFSRLPKNWLIIIRWRQSNVAFMVKDVLFVTEEINGKVLFDLYKLILQTVWLLEAYTIGMAWKWNLKFNIV